MGVADRMQKSLADKVFSGIGLDPAAIMLQVSQFVAAAERLDQRISRIEQQNAEILRLLNNAEPAHRPAELLLHNGVLHHDPRE